MASTYSTSLKIQLMGNGEDSGTWGSITNANWNLMEQAVSGVQTITMANANYTLTNLNGVPDEARNMVLVVNGTNSAIRQIIAPLAPKMYVVSNQTVGGFAITIGGASGSIITVPTATTVQVYCDGTNFYSAQTSSAGNFNVNGNLTVNGSSTLTGAVAAGSTLSAAGLLTASAGITSTTGNFSGNLASLGSVSGASGVFGAVSGTTGTFTGAVSGTTGTFSGTVTGSSFSGAGTGLTGTAASLTAGAATLAAKSSTLASGGGNGSAMTFTYTDTGGQPTYVWGANSIGNSQVFNPAAFSVAYATSAGNSATTNQTTFSSLLSNTSVTSYGQTIAYQELRAGVGGSGGDCQIYVNSSGSTGYIASVNLANSAGRTLVLNNNNSPVVIGSGPVYSGVGLTLNNNSIAVPNNHVICQSPSTYGGGGRAMVNSDNSMGAWSLGSGYYQAYSGATVIGFSFFISDETVKENIKPTDYAALDTVRKFKFIEFDYKPDYPKDGHVECGISAQQVQSFAPNLVQDQGGLLAPRIDELLYVALKAIQELEAKVAALEAK